MSSNYTRKFIVRTKHHRYFTQYPLLLCHVILQSSPNSCRFVENIRCMYVDLFHVYTNAVLSMGDLHAQ
uniref:Uncharacterized protein n=1 Tax=Arundo donax TaxID=35708 RepID=A0A0A9E234_ARUDO